MAHATVEAVDRARGLEGYAALAAWRTGSPEPGRRSRSCRSGIRLGSEMQSRQPAPAIVELRNIWRSSRSGQASPTQGPTDRLLRSFKAQQTHGALVQHDAGLALGVPPRGGRAPCPRRGSWRRTGRRRASTIISKKLTSAGAMSTPMSPRAGSLTKVLMRIPRQPGLDTQATPPRPAAGRAPV